MNLIILALKRGLPIIILIIMVYVIARLLLIKKYPINSRKKEFIVLVFVVYLAIMLGVTIVPIWRLLPNVDGSKQLEIIWETENSSVNLIPFKTLTAQLFGTNNNVENYKKISFLNVLGNLLIMLPFGFAISYFLRNSKKALLLTLVYSFLLTFFIEVIQYFIGRSSDIDDIILNMCGAVLGFLAFKLLYAMHFRDRSKSAS